MNLKILMVLMLMCFCHGVAYAQEVDRSLLPETLERYAIAEYTGGNLVDIRSAWEAMDRDKTLLAFVKENYPTYYSRYVIRGLIYRVDELKEEYAEMLHLKGDVSADLETLQQELAQRIAELKKALDSGESVLNNRQAALDGANQYQEANSVSFEESNSAYAIENANKVTYSNADRARESANKVTRSNNQIMYDALRRATQGQ